MIGLSFDTDWQDGEVLQFTLDLLKKFEIKATFFCTNKTKVKISGHEIAIHPNFSKKDIKRALADLKKNFPQAKGLRSHGILTGNEIIQASQEKKLLYESNYLMYLQKDIRPFKVYQIWELPIYYMDFYHLAIEKEPQFNLKYLKLNQPGLKIFDFHPIHVYLNTNSTKHYLRYKQDPKNIKRYIDKDKPGIRTLFIAMLEKIGKGDYRLFKAL